MRKSQLPAIGFVFMLGLAGCGGGGGGDPAAQPSARSLLDGTVITTTQAGCATFMGTFHPGQSEGDVTPAAPTKSTVAAFAQSVELALRENFDVYLKTVGILGREFWNLNGTDPEYTGALMGKAGAQLPADSPLLTVPFLKSYRTVQPCAILIRAASAAGDLTASEVDGVEGFGQTLQAYSLLLVLNRQCPSGSSSRRSSLCPSSTCGGNKGGGDINTGFSSSEDRHCVEGDRFSDAGHKAAIDRMAGKEGYLWVWVRDAKPDGSVTDDKVESFIQGILDYAISKGVKVILYPHYNTYYATTEDALRLVEKINHPSFGVAINLCHELMSQKGDNLAKTFEMAKGRILAVILSGAKAELDKKSVRTRNQSTIQALDESPYDLRPFMRLIKESGFEGPVGFINFKLSDPEDYLERSITRWNELCEEVGLYEKAAAR